MSVYLTLTHIMSFSWTDHVPIIVWIILTSLFLNEHLKFAMMNVQKTNPNSIGIDNNLNFTIHTH